MPEYTEDLRVETLAHYDRMIEWASKQEPGEHSSWDAFDDSGESPRGTECPLCLRFSRVGCTYCPVMKKTGKWLCEGSPYEDLRTAIGGRLPWDDVVPVLKAERDFLASLPVDE